MSGVVALAEGAAQFAESAGIAPIWFGVGTFVVFLALLAVTYAFRNVWTRH